MKKSKRYKFGYKNVSIRLDVRKYSVLKDFLPQYGGYSGFVRFLIDQFLKENGLKGGDNYGK